MRRLALGLAAATALAGCIDLAPTYRRPPSPVPARFPTGPAYAPPSGAATIVGWRAFFSDPRLVRVIDRALADNRDLRLAVANVAIARAQYRVQRADLLPRLSATASGSFGQTPSGVFSGGTPGPSAQVNQRAYSLGATAAWQLDLFGKIRDLTRAAQAQYFSTREARDAAQIVLVDEVASAWLTLQADQSLLTIARETRSSGQASLDLTSRRLAVGVASGLDEAQARTIVEQARFDEARLTSQVAQDRNALELLVGAPVADADLPGGPPGEAVVLERLPAAVSSDVLLNRPDVVAAEDALRAANANIGAARASFFPSISLTGQGGVASQALATLFKGAAETWSFVPTLTQPIFQGGANLANLSLAKAERDAALARYEKAIQVAFREVSDALAERGSIEAQFDAQTALEAAARQSLTLAQARYERGVDTYLNVLIAQRTLYAAQLSLETTRLAREANLVTLYGVLGGGLDRP